MRAQQLARPRKQPFAERRQRDGLIVPFEQPSASYGFETLDMDADRSRASVNMLGRRTKLAEPRHRMKGAQEFDIEDGFHGGSARLNDLINIF